MATSLLSRLLSTTTHRNELQSRSLFYWLTPIFNKVDYDRIKKLGPDRVCAEWLLKNGAYVRWKGSIKHLDDYNALPAEGSYHYLQAVDATNAGITYVGFPHFEGCKHIEEIKFAQCKYIDNRAMSLLPILKDTLTHLEVVNCKAVTDAGLRELKALKKLKVLKLGGLEYVENRKLVEEELGDALPGCTIEFK
ncbi:hypothetical protein KM043_007317 [Ampulex compressa]|nr:hypothetical protein KM043_007317 [Ampulex compressa]